jgi:hypothetical protein
VLGGQDIDINCILPPEEELLSLFLYYSKGFIIPGARITRGPLFFLLSYQELSAALNQSSWKGIGFCEIYFCLYQLFN